MLPSEIALAILSVILIVLRFVEKKDTKAVVELINAQTTAIGVSIEAVIKGFEPQIERTKRIHGIAEELQRVHRASDTDGRPFVYLPKEFIETQKEIAKAISTQAMILDYMSKDIGNIKDRMEALEKECLKRHA